MECSHIWSVRHTVPETFFPNLASRLDAARLELSSSSPLVTRLSHHRLRRNSARDLVPSHQSFCLKLQPANLLFTAIFELPVYLAYDLAAICWNFVVAEHV